MQDPYVVTLTIIWPASHTWAYARWLRGLTLDDYLAHSLDRQQAFDLLAASRILLDELAGAGIAP